MILVSSYAVRLRSLNELTQVIASIAHAAANLLASRSEFGRPLIRVVPGQNDVGNTGRDAACREVGGDWLGVGRPVVAGSDRRKRA
jgi:hypothetical protein